jgi:Tol biopolymer transport system component
VSQGATAAVLTTAVLCLFPAQGLGSATTERVSVSSSGEQGDYMAGYGRGISRNGRFVVFSSQADNLVPDDTNYAEDVFLRDRLTGTTTRVSVSSTGEQADEDSYVPAISANGRYVAYITWATNLAPGGPPYPMSKVMLYDRWTQTTTYISPETGAADDPAISADGSVIAYEDPWRDWMIDVYDRDTGTTSFASVNAAGARARGESFDPAVSASGRLVAFRSDAANLSPRRDTNGTDDVFIHNMETGNTTEVSLNSNGRLGNRASGFPALSANGRYVAFESRATNLVPKDTNGERDVFVRDRWSGTTRRVSVGWLQQQGNGDSCCPSVSADGSRVTFLSWATNLKPNPTNGEHVFLRDLASRWLQLVDVSSAGRLGDRNGDVGMISADGSYVVFPSRATNLVPNDTNQVSDIFVRGPFE